MPALTILLFYVLTYELNYKANFDFIVFKFIIYILYCPLLFILSIQGNNPTVPIYMLLSTLFYSILHCILFTVLYYMYSILFYMYPILNLTVSIYILFETQLKSSSNSTFQIFEKRHKSLHLSYRSIVCTKLKLMCNPIVLKLSPPTSAAGVRSPSWP